MRPLQNLQKDLLQVVGEGVLVAADLERGYQIPQKDFPEKDSPLQVRDRNQIRIL